MPFAIEQKKFGFKKEASRGVPETAPVKSLAVGADSELTYNTALIADDKLRGLKERFPSVAGIKEGPYLQPTLTTHTATKKRPARW